MRVHRETATPVPCLLWWQLRRERWQPSPGKMPLVTSVSSSIFLYGRVMGVGSG
jgi:hypothetical protein